MVQSQSVPIVPAPQTIDVNHCSQYLYAMEAIDRSQPEQYVTSRFRLISLVIAYVRWILRTVTGSIRDLLFDGYWWELYERGEQQPSVICRHVRRSLATSVAGLL